MANLQLLYCIVCDDVRLEMGNKLSLMGVHGNIYLPAFPAMLLKLTVVNHWTGTGQYQTQVKLFAPDHRELAASAPSQLAVETNGYADNVTFFTNLAMERPGAYTVHVMIDGRTVAEKRIVVHLVEQMAPSNPSATIN